MLPSIQAAQLKRFGRHRVGRLSYTELASRVAVAKLRLGGTPTPRSWVARMTKRPAPPGAGKSASPAGARNNGVDAMTELTQAALAKELGVWPATVKGWTWEWQRCGRYDYRKCLTRSTNPDHLVPGVPSPTNVPLLQIATRYAAGRPRAPRRVQPDGD